MIKTYKITYINDGERCDYFVQSSSLKRLFLECLEFFGEDYKLISIEPVHYVNLDRCEYFDILEKRLDGFYGDDE